MRERSIAPTPIAVLLPRITRSRTHLWTCRRALWQETVARGPVGTIEPEEETNFQPCDVTEIPRRIHAAPGGMREQQRSSERRRLAHVISRGTASELCANRGPAPSSRDLSIFFVFLSERRGRSSNDWLPRRDSGSWYAAARPRLRGR